MKKGFMLGLMFFGMLGICSQASAENIFAGKVAASNTSVISAPYGGRVDNIYVHVGDYVGEDSLIATLGTDEVYALATVTAKIATFILEKPCICPAQQTAAIAELAW